MKRMTKVAAVFAGLWCAAAQGDFVVEKVDATRVDEVIRVRVDLDLSLTDATEQALSNGVPLIVLHEIALRKNGLFWNRVEQEISEKFRLRYYALSGQYVVDGEGSSMDVFQSVNDALEMISFASATFTAPSANEQYVVAVRSRIDINALPAPLRPTALFSPQWQLSSDWSQWPIESSSTN